MLAFIVNRLKRWVIKTEVIGHNDGNSFVTIHGCLIRELARKSGANKFFHKVSPYHILQKNLREITYSCFEFCTNINVSIIKGAR
jgi:hypothetical protein